MYSIPKIKRFSSITEQGQKSWRSNLSSNSKRNIILQDIIHNLDLIKDDLISFFENNKEYLFPTDNEEYICIDSSSSIVPAEELLYRLIDILKNDDFISRLEEASSTIDSLAKELDEAKKEIKKYTTKKSNDGPLSSYRSGISDNISKELLNKLKEKNLINQKISKDYDNLIDEYISGLTQKSEYEQKIRNLEDNLKNFENIKIKNEELTEKNKQMNDEIFLIKNELNELKQVNNKLYEENIKTKEELQRMYKLIEFKNKEYADLTEKNKLLLKNEYIANMQMQRNEDKLKLCCNNLKVEKERNKEIIDNLEKQINEKEEEINIMRKKLKNNISALLKENKSNCFKYLLDEINNKLKIVYKGEIICSIPKYTREMPTSFFHRKKYKISSNIHPNMSDINENSINNYKPMTMSKNKFTEINNFNITYKLSKNEYEFDYSNSNHSHSNSIPNNNSISNSSFRLDKLYDQIISNDSISSNNKSNHKPISNSGNKTFKKSFSQNVPNYLSEKKDKNEDGEKKNESIRRAKTDVKGKKLLNKIGKNMMKVNSFGFGLDVVSIKEEKDEDNISISNFDIQINKQDNNDNHTNEKNKIVNNFCSMSNFLENSSIAPDVTVKDRNKMLVINHVEELELNRKYLYPKNVKLNVKKVSVKRVIYVNKDKGKEKEKISNGFNNNINSDNIEGCYIF